VYGLYSFGNKLDENCERCPFTTSLVEGIPGLKMAGFSALLPGTHIEPHSGYAGYSDTVLRGHLGGLDFELHSFVDQVI
jgi:beta-hydroxylase